ncbi:Holliday junction resolvase RecU [Bacillus pseudomycoides]|uniref:Holliday junction resolvase RecU n=1 Tax=Bacillus pseudomycoides TaxID=64104 RepID=UPI000BEC0498|nr:Holliday junction resolvase RecU [Bacillus pseudomycoides]PED06928.1 Holliday junction resolvase RecU [Bacillus pseudomycoides]PEI98917.1 Holliday junction resolvase RecU [Bacillus pseudomycoides]PEK29773.1 Holliday junction resolvase RecU [Bacillus pseudomycoides]PEM68288.1 Holliday junction resolvase RecU [Bacillus pseudomycoides]PEO15659.1 Holliday junction resolvase RecU [Bacillus pseudomycoides]
MGLGNRGMHFEKLINLSNEMYQREGVALINKRPTPVKVIKSRGSQVTNGFYESKSTVDYDGVYKGRAVAFEAKSTQSLTRFDLSNIAQHQLDYLEKAEKMGAVCFFLIEFSKDKTVFLVPATVIQSYVRMSHQPNGKKSIPRADFDIYGYLVDQTERAPVDYLRYIDETGLIPMMLGGMIQIDQDYTKIANNIEAAKEKMNNKKRKILKA